MRFYLIVALLCAFVVGCSETTDPTNPQSIGTSSGDIELAEVSKATFDGMTDMEMIELVCRMSADVDVKAGAGVRTLESMGITPPAGKAELDGRDGVLPTALQLAYMAAKAVNALNNGNYTLNQWMQKDLTGRKGYQVAWLDPVPQNPNASYLRYMMDSPSDSGTHTLISPEPDMIGDLASGLLTAMNTPGGVISVYNDPGSWWNFHFRIRYNTKNGPRLFEMYEAVAIEGKD